MHLHSTDRHGLRQITVMQVGARVHGIRYDSVSFDDSEDFIRLSQNPAYLVHLSHGFRPKKISGSRPQLLITDDIPDDYDFDDSSKN